MRTIILAISDCLLTMGIILFIVASQLTLDYAAYPALAGGFLFALRHKIEEIAGVR